MLELSSSQIGETARRLLTPGETGQVLAGLSGASYLVTEREELFWLASADAPMHARGMRVAGHFPKLATGRRFYIEGECIFIATDLKVDFGDASTWTVPPIQAEAAVGIEQMAFRLESILPTSSELSQASGFGRLIPRILSLGAGGSDDEVETDPVLALAWHGIDKVARACLSRDMSGLLHEADALVGLGEGLTPSGDDFLGGLLFCTNTIQRLYPGTVHLNPSEQASFIESAKQRTNLISFTMLKDLANGHAVEPLHVLINFVFGDQPLQSVRPASDLIQIGNSTGWDLLTGALTGLLSTFRSPDSVNSSAIHGTLDRVPRGSRKEDGERTCLDKDRIHM